MTNWPEYFLVAEHPNGTIMGYSECLEMKSTIRQASRFLVMGKAEGNGESWHGHGKQRIYECSATYLLLFFSNSDLNCA